MSLPGRSRILRGEHEKWLDQFPDFPAGRHTFFLHRLQHRRLGLRRRAIDFIRKNKVRENRPALELKFAPATRDFHDDIRPQDIGEGIRSGVN